MNTDEKAGVWNVTSAVTWRLCREFLEGSSTYCETRIRWNLGVHFNIRFNLFHNQTFSNFSQLPADTDFLFSKFPVLGDTIKWTPELQEIAPALLVISVITFTHSTVRDSSRLCGVRHFAKQLQHSQLTFWSLTTYIYIYRTAALTSRRYILNIYSTNIHTEYFKHAA